MVRGVGKGALGDSIARRVARLGSAHVQLVVEVLQRPPGKKVLK